MDFYAELGVTPQAEPDVIRAAYRALAKRYHPDRQEGLGLAAAAKMARLNRAYEVLRHPESRCRYDRHTRPLARDYGCPCVYGWQRCLQREACL